ncbi:WbqC family protein [bacterium]|nr:WbqC family protein [bacterium]
MKAAILQPGYLPWIGFFDLAARSDIFVILDCVQFDKRSWRNRNRIRTAEDWQWLTVPVITKGKFTQRIDETRIDNTRNWGKKHLTAIWNHYSKAPHFKEYFPSIEEALGEQWELLVELDMHFIRLLDDAFGLGTNWTMASTLSPSGKKADLIVEICKLVGADEYLNGAMGRSYLREDQFKAEGIELRIIDYDHPVYRQCYDGFVSHLSAIDLLFNLGKDAREVLLGNNGTRDIIE